MAKAREARLSAHQTRELLRRARLDTAAASGFAFRDAAPRRTYAAHTHVRHQLLYALAGTASVQADDATFVLPPQRAAFIPAGVKHLTSHGSANVVSLFFDPALVRAKASARSVTVIDVSPLMREMVQFALRWPPARRKADRLANAFFRTFGLLLEEWLEQPSPYRLPRGKSRLVQRAIAITVERAGAISLSELGRAVGAAPRTLRRHLAGETGLTFRNLSSTARALSAMELLSVSENSVTDVALAVGFRSLSAFAKSFARVAGEPPSAFRARSRLGAGSGPGPAQR